MRIKKYVTSKTSNVSVHIFQCIRNYSLASAALVGLLFTGCGPNTTNIGGYTTVTIAGGSRSNVSSLSQVSNYASSLLQRPDMNSLDIGTLTGGVMVYLQGVGSTTSAYGMYLSDETSTSSLQLQNGTYMGYSIGYTGTSMGGPMKCGVANSGTQMTFNGTSQTVQFTLSGANCSSFTPNQTAFVDNPVPQLVVNSCTRLLSSSNISQCTGDYTGNVASASVQIRPFAKENGALTFPTATTGSSLQSIVSPCIAVTGTTTQGINLPIGSSATPFQMPVSITGFRAPGCNGNSKFGTYNFNSNIGAGVTTISNPDGSTPIFTTDIPSTTIPSSASPTSFYGLMLRDFSAGSGSYAIPTYSFSATGTSTSINSIVAVAIGPTTHTIYAADSALSLKQGTFNGTFGTLISSPSFSGGYIGNIALDSAENIYVTASGYSGQSNAVVKIQTGGGGTPSTLIYGLAGGQPPRVAVSGSGKTIYAVENASLSPKLYISTNFGSTFTVAPASSTPPLNSFNMPTNIAVDSAGNIYIAHTSDNNFLVSIDGGNSFLNKTFNQPIASIFIDSNDNIYILGGTDNFVYESVNGGGNFIKLPGSHSSYAPFNMTVDSSNGNIFIGEYRAGYNWVDLLHL